MNSSSNKQYTFTIVNGAVVEFFEVENGFTEQESIDSSDTFVIEGSQITHTKQTSSGLEVTVFSDPEGDGFYRVASRSDDDSGSGGSGSDDGSSGGSRKAFKFDIVNGEVVGVFELEDGVLESKSIDDDGSETYVVEGDVVVRTEQKAFGAEVTRYEDQDGDGLYLRISEQWVSSSDAPSGGFAHKLSNPLSFSFTDDDDFIAVRGGDDSRGGLGSDQFVIREAAHLRIEDFSSIEGDLLVFDTGYGLASKAHLARFITDIHHNGQDFIVDFGPNVSITLVGVQPGQISVDDVSVLS
ncbi:MAG: hypothetical protein H6937_06580 [Burkholderiales bacterium]|nr:hypothetical protein [Burkholderiales bacterium]MDR4518841.1 hypothetical protein [Nitrosomonas sp.]